MSLCFVYIYNILYTYSVFCKLCYVTIVTSCSNLQLCVFIDIVQSIDFCDCYVFNCNCKWLLCLNSKQSYCDPKFPSYAKRLFIIRVFPSITPLVHYLSGSRVTILVEGRWQFGPVQSFTDLIRLQKLSDDWLLLRDLLEYVRG